jgi:serine/threonine protein kinase
LADSKQLREMFLNEARIAARLEHPNIVATYELGEVDGKYFISMEYLPGEDLSAIIAGCQDGRMPVAIAAALTQQAAQGLHYATRRATVRESRSAVHRDVSPRNIFVTYHGVVKLLDFGVVRGPEKQKSIPGVFKGKYGYCAPEQIEGGHIDRRTDVFCLGIALWECLTGARLFDASTTYRPSMRSAHAHRGTEHAAPGGSAGAGRDHAAGARARSGAALSQRPRPVRGAGSLPARARRTAHQQDGGPLDGVDLRGERAR